MTLKKISTPIRYQHLTEDPNFTSYFQFSDPGGGLPRQLEFPPGRYFFLFGGKVDGFRIQTRDESGEWTFTDVTANPYLHEVKFTSTGTIMARKTDKAPGDAHMVIIAPQLADLFAGRWRHGAKTHHENIHRQRPRLGSQQEGRGNNTRAQRPRNPYHASLRVLASHQYPNGGHWAWGPGGPRHHQRNHRRGNCIPRGECLRHSHLPQPLTTVGGGA